MIHLADCSILRDLAKQVAEIAAPPVQASRRRQWVRHYTLQSKHPMVLVFSEGAWQELLPEHALLCQGEEAHRIEWQLRSRIYHHAHLQDDTVIEGEWIVQKVVHSSGWGLQPKRIASPEARGAYMSDPVLLEPSDLHKLQVPKVTYDPEATQRAPAHLVGDFDEAAMRSYIRRTLETTHREGCVLEMVLKDTHTCGHWPERFDRWTHIARQENERLGV